MKKPYSEGVAHRTDPESWGGTVRYPFVGVAAQALTGAHASRILSREISVLGDADAVLLCRRQYCLIRLCARMSESPAVLDLERAWKPTTRNPGDPVVFQAYGSLERSGSLRA